MSVNAQHAEYKEQYARWHRCRAVMSGQDAVHAGREKFLPRLKEQGEEEYVDYVRRATFYNATWRTIAGLRGMIFRKPPHVEVPAAIKPMLEDVTMAGTSFDSFAQSITDEALGLGRVGVLVDFPRIDVQQITQADAARLKLRPMMQLYKAEQCINWRCEYVNNVWTLVQVVLCEYTQKPMDEFEKAVVQQFRVLDLTPAGYRVRIFEIHDGKDVQIGGDVYPLMNSKPLDFIPFTFIGLETLGAEVDDPPLIDLVDLNLSHYRTNADLEHGAHFTGLPTPWVAGHREETDANGVPRKLYIGSAAAWVFSDPDTKAGYLEFTGQGLGALERLLERKERQMAILGARMLEPQKKAPETAEAQQNQRKGEESMLASAAQMIGHGLSRALRWFCAWAGSPSESVEVELNRNFYPAPMTPQMLTALVSSWQQGAFSDQVLFDNLQKGEIISEGATLEEEQARLAAKEPQFAPGQAGNVTPLRSERTVIEGPQGDRYTVRRE